MLLKIPLIAGLAMLTFVGQAMAQQVVGQRPAPHVALVIGNGAYAQAPIDNALEGARAVADTLLQGGFKVVYLQNTWRDDFKQGLETFTKNLERGARAIVFYSGHAVQYRGRNYLVMLDSLIFSPDDLQREAIDISLVLDPLLAAQTPGSVIFLDASRSNPWQTNLPGGVRGLASPEAAPGVSFVLATTPGEVVSNARQASGVFAAQLAEAMKTPGLGLNDVVSRTRSAVTFLNGRDQLVWQSGPIPADLVVLPGVQPPGVKPPDTVEAGFWASIKDSSAAKDFQDYLGAYPNGQFAATARSRLAQLQPKLQEIPANRDPTTRQTVAIQPNPPAPPPPAPAASPPPAAAPSAAQAPAAPPPVASTPRATPPAARPAQPPAAAPAPTTTAGLNPPNTPVPQAQAPSAPTVQGAASLRDCPVCPELVLIPAGTLTMGSADGFPFEGPVHDVTIAQPFYIGRREVTFDEWDACHNEGGCAYQPGDRGEGRGTRPVTDLDWNDAKAYVAWLSRKTKKTYRLPTEAEWEYAARAGSKTAFYWGNIAEKERANCMGCNATALNKAAPTGSFPPNAFGLFDMAGNAAEWVEDCWTENYKATPKDGSAFSKPDCRERVLRGGSFNNDQRYARTAARFKYDFDVRYYTNGFRVVRER